MSYVLVLITIFSSSDALHSQTRFQEFATRAACERAAAAIREDVAGLPGTLGREVVARCHALG